MCDLLGLTQLRVVVRWSGPAALWFMVPILNIAPEPALRAKFIAH
jgi:hypothetical protein